MTILSNYDLTHLNTFRVPAKAKFFAEVHSEKELTELFTTPVFKENEKLFLGGGSNILFTHDFDGIVVANKIKGVEIVEDNTKDVLVRAMSGEVWHDLVTFVVGRGYWGIENLAFIPGTVGAAPMQNIGAYGVELKSVFESVEAVDVDSGEKRFFKKEECNFGYRDSIFKNEQKGKYFILAITLRLSKISDPKLHYKHLREHLEKNKVEVKTPQDVSEAVTAIRKSKLPDPKIIPNAGSFFKNIFLPQEKLEELLKKYPDMPFFEEGGVRKIPAAWLIEQAGWKGKKVGRVGVHDKQALVLVNNAEGTGEELHSLAKEIIASVYDKFGIRLVPEVNLV